VGENENAQAIAEEKSGKCATELAKIYVIVLHYCMCVFRKRNSLISADKPFDFRLSLSLPIGVITGRMSNLW